MEKQNNIKLVIFSLLPLTVLLLSAEAVVRLFSLDRPAILAGGSSVGADWVQSDIDLGWSYKPNSSGDAGGGELSVQNNLGLRSPEIGTKKPDEFRILSLGESSTWGAFVANDETYSAQLQKILTERAQSRPITVVNAGVSAYSSYQSLTYLKLRGLMLRPDLILFYHEINDYLPSTIRDYEMNEVGVLMTDKELYGSKLSRINGTLEKHSAVYRFLVYAYANYKIGKLNRDKIENPITDIGLPPKLRVRGFIGGAEDAGEPDGELSTMALGRRVSESERLENLRELALICRKNHIELIVIHPAYAYSKPHECLLTRFCSEESVRMFEAFPSLHPEGIRRDYMYMDWWHPSAYGHQRLAESLADFIEEQILSARSNQAEFPRRPITQDSVE